MSGSVVLVIVLLWASEFDAVFHVHCVLHSHEVVVPGPVLRNLSINNVFISMLYNRKYKKSQSTTTKGGFTVCSHHIEPEEAVTQEHLNLLVVGGKVTMGIAVCVLVQPSPFISGLR